MDIINVVGTRGTSFTGSDGRQVNGCSFFYTMPDPHVTGVSTGKCFISEAKLDTLSIIPRVGDSVRVLYNRFGKVDDFLPLPPQGDKK